MKGRGFGVGMRSLIRSIVIISFIGFAGVLGLYAAGHFQSVNAQANSDQNEQAKANSQASDNGYPSADYGAKPEGVYKELEVNHGVYNDGQAALWDLNALDHFKFFGPYERARGYKPSQPIKFSHVTHVQANKMECTYCHYSVNKAAFAAIPPVETCWGCHQLIKGQTPEQNAEIKKIEDYVSKGLEIPWQKVHVFPDHAHFNHKRHVKAGVTCQECHGQIPNMQTVERATSMKMGWCLDCHRQRATSIDCYSCHY